MATNLHLAPPPVTTGGLLAVPIDIATIDARLTLDAATATGSGTATLTFTCGPADGCPVFDLRQTITGLQLDGASVPATAAQLRDLGGGPGAQMRVLDRVLTAGSTHTLRVDYSVGPPQSPSGGSYQPALTTSAGPRLRLTFGFTDLVPARYLEAWVPANLVYDQFALRLEIEVTNTGVAHTLVTNGTVTTLGVNHWRADFPPTTTAFSTLVELHATDRLASTSLGTVLPGSGQSVTVDAWKQTTSTIDLAAAAADIAGWLGENDSQIGRYRHGGRFVAYLGPGGMEYDGGTTSGLGPLRHETYHSWWGRGLKPASQPDAWFDEGWNTYHDDGGAGSDPFDFTDPPVTLRSAVRWSRETSSQSYGAGSRFFEGVAALVGAPTLTALMRELYNRPGTAPVPTEAIEELLLARTGEPLLVDAFARFVYGIAAAPGADLWLRDDPAHTGADPWGGRFWDSPDLWLRNADDGGTTHQDPEAGQDNWFHARIRNRGTATARHFAVTFAAKPFAGTQFAFPGDFLPSIAAVAGFDLAPGATRVVKARWPRALVPPAGTHVCWLASVITPGDTPPAGRHVWERNDLAQKNLTVVDLVPGAVFTLPIVAGRLVTRRPLVLELRRPPHLPELEVSLLQRSGAVLPVPQPRPPRSVLVGPSGAALSVTGLPRLPAPAGPEGRHLFPPGRGATLLLPPSTRQLRLGLQVRAPAGAAGTKPFTVDLVQRDGPGGRVVGGVAVTVRVR